MDWTRGKKGKREALSGMTGATYVYVEGKLRVARAKGEWEDLGMFPDIGAAKEVAQIHDKKLAYKCLDETRERVDGLIQAANRSKLRAFYNDIVKPGAWEAVYREYCYLRDKGITPIELQNHMESMSLVDRELLGRAYEDFYNAGMRVV